MSYEKSAKTKYNKPLPALPKTFQPGPAMPKDNKDYAKATWGKRRNARLGNKLIGSMNPDNIDINTIDIHDEKLGYSDIGSDTMHNKLGGLNNTIKRGIPDRVKKLTMGKFTDHMQQKDNDTMHKAQKVMDQVAQTYKLKGIFSPNEMLSETSKDIIKASKEKAKQNTPAADVAKAVLDTALTGEDVQEKNPTAEEKDDVKAEAKEEKATEQAGESLEKTAKVAAVTGESKEIDDTATIEELRKIDTSGWDQKYVDEYNNRMARYEAAVAQEKKKKPNDPHEKQRDAVKYIGYASAISKYGGLIGRTAAKPVTGLLNESKADTGGTGTSGPAKFLEAETYRQMGEDYFTPEEFNREDHLFEDNMGTSFNSSALGINNAITSGLDVAGKSVDYHMRKDYRDRKDNAAAALGIADSVTGVLGGAGQAIGGSTAERQYVSAGIGAAQSTIKAGTDTARAVMAIKRVADMKKASSASDTTRIQLGLKLTKEEKKAGKTKAEASEKSRQSAADLAEANMPAGSSPQAIEDARNKAMDEKRKRQVNEMEKNLMRKTAISGRRMESKEAKSGLIKSFMNLGFSAGRMALVATGFPELAGLLKTTGAIVNTAYDFISGKVIGKIAGGEEVKLINKQIELIKLQGGLKASYLADINNYDDIKKKFRIGYAIYCRRDEKNTNIIDLPDMDFKTLMSNALSGEAGGKRGLVNAIAKKNAKEVRGGVYDGEEDQKFLKAAGIVDRKDGTLMNKETIDQRMGVKSNDAGTFEGPNKTYRYHQTKYSADVGPTKYIDMKNDRKNMPEEIRKIKAGADGVADFRKRHGKPVEGKPATEPNTAETTEGIAPNKPLPPIPVKNRPPNKPPPPVPVRNRPPNKPPPPVPVRNRPPSRTPPPVPSRN